MWHRLTLCVLQAPYLSYDATKTGNARFSGMDVELINALATQLGFTYTLNLMDRRMNESWSDTLIRASSEGDLCMSFWGKTTRRLDNVLFLPPHIDGTRKLMVKLATPTESSTVDTMFTFLEPFSFGLWMLLLAMVFVYGFVIWWVEKDSRRNEDFLNTNTSSGALFQSMYFSASMFLQFGGHSPTTKGGRMLLAAFGFSNIVIIAAYTANLAAYLTTSATITQPYTTLQDVKRAGEKTCVLPVDMDLLNGYYPELTSSFRTIQSSNKIEAGLQAGDCVAAVTPQYQVAQMKTKQSWCGYTTYGMDVFSLGASWVTNKDSACVAGAFSKAFHQTIVSGDLEKLMLKYFPSYQCPNGEDTSSEQLTPTNMAGVFVINAVIIFGVMALKLAAQVYRGSSDRSEEEDGDVTASVAMRAEPGSGAEIELMHVHKQTEAALSIDEAHARDQLALARAKLSELQTILKGVGHSDDPDPLIEPLLNRMVQEVFPRYDFNKSHTLDTEEELTQMTMHIFQKMVQVVWIDKEYLAVALSHIKDTYAAGQASAKTPVEYVTWLLPFLHGAKPKPDGAPVPDIVTEEPPSMGDGPNKNGVRTV